MEIIIRICYDEKGLRFPISLSIGPFSAEDVKSLRFLLYECEINQSLISLFFSSQRIKVNGRDG